MYIGTLPRSQTRLYLEYRQAGQFLNVDLCARCNHHRIDIRTRLNLWPLAEPTATFSADIVIRSGTNREIILTNWSPPRGERNISSLSQPIVNYLIIIRYTSIPNPNDESGARIANVAIRIADDDPNNPQQPATLFT